MSQLLGLPTGNLLLRALNGDDLSKLAPDLTRVELAREMVLAKADEPVEFIYFPEGGIASIVADLPEQDATEVGIFGREGMSAISQLLADGRSTTSTFMQVDGTTALRIDFERVQEAMEASATLRRTLLRYAHVHMTQLTHSVATNTRQSLEVRLARWLLMCQDRLDGDEVQLTHGFMAMMIGAQRTGVTVTLPMLEGQGLIKSKRACVIILDRTGLEIKAGGAYGKAEGEYRRLIGPLGRPPEAPITPPLAAGAHPA
jgi:CRP-like cAMP-binding protein